MLLRHKTGSGKCDLRHINSSSDISLTCLRRLRIPDRLQLLHTLGWRVFLILLVKFHACTDFLEIIHERHHVAVERSYLSQPQRAQARARVRYSVAIVCLLGIATSPALSHHSLHHISSLKQISPLVEAVCRIKPHLDTLQLLQVLSVNQIEIIPLMQEPSMILPCRSTSSYLSTK
jgi:hypothetical protein